MFISLIGARVPNGGIIQGVDVRYAATYGNPHLRTGLSTVHTAKPASTPAPPPYSSVRSSVIIPSGNLNFIFTNLVIRTLKVSISMTRNFV